MAQITTPEFTRRFDKALKDYQDTTERAKAQFTVKTVARYVAARKQADAKYEDAMEALRNAVASNA